MPAIDMATMPLRKKPRARPSKSASGSIESSIRDELGKLLAARGAVHRSKLLSHLSGMGYLVDVKDPMRRLAIYLSRMPEVEGDGAGNWRLVSGNTGHVSSKK
jgi:hypothetical protein